KTQQHISKMFRKESDKAMKGLLKAIQQLNNCDDLTNLLEIHDAADELAILRQLFTTQKGIIGQMIDAYGSIDRRQPEEERHGLAITWLEDAKQKVSGYVEKTEELTKRCEEVKASVSDPWTCSQSPVTDT